MHFDSKDRSTRNGTWSYSLDLAMPVYVEDIRESLNLALPGYVENIH